MRTADVNNPPEDKQVFFVERLDAIPTGGKDLLARAKPVLLVLYAGQAMYPGNVLVLQNIKGDPRSSSKTRIRLSLHGITYIYELFLDGNEARLSTLIQAKKTRGEAPLVVDRAGLPAAYEAKAETWEWLARKPIPTGSTTYRWSRAHVITRDAFRVGNTVADVMIDKQDGTGPVKTAITFQEWVRCHGIKESAALSWSQAQLLECFLIFANGDVMASPLPWMVDVTGMLVPGRSTFGWVSPTTVDELLPEWFRESNTNIISKSITDVEAWQATWLDCINKSPTRTPALFKHLPDWFT